MPSSESPLQQVHIPGNYTPERPPTLNESICDHKYGCANCSVSSDEDDGSEEDFEDLSQFIGGLGLEDIERIRFSALNSSQTYTINDSEDANRDVEAAEAISQFLHEHVANHSQRRVDDETYQFRVYPWNIDDFIEMEPSSPSGDSMLVNPSSGEQSMTSSITSSMYLSIRSASPHFFTKHSGAGFQTCPSHFTARPLELTEPFSAHLCAHGSVCIGSPMTQELGQAVATA